MWNGGNEQSSRGAAMGRTAREQQGVDERDAENRKLNETETETYKYSIFDLKECDGSITRAPSLAAWAWGLEARAGCAG